MRTTSLALLAAGLACAAPARADLSPEQLARIAQNPLANVISVPLQYNDNFDAGPAKGRLGVLNIQPVIPASLNEDWNLITRAVIPIIRQSGMFPGGHDASGLGDVQMSMFLSPSKPGPGGLIWGAGVVAQVPTDEKGLGNKNWGLGPTFAVLKMQQANPWVLGVLVSNVSSISSAHRGGHYGNLLIQPIVSYNLAGGTYINTVPLITANRAAAPGQKWTVPMGMGVGHIFHIGPAPVNAQIGAYYNVVRPDHAASWQLRAQAQFMFPK